MIQDFEMLIKQYRPTTHNGTETVSLVTLDKGQALLRVETASMASKVIIHEAPDQGTMISEKVVKSLEKSLRDNSEIWDELSKH